MEREGKSEGRERERGRGGGQKRKRYGKRRKEKKEERRKMKRDTPQQSLLSMSFDEMLSKPAPNAVTSNLSHLRYAAM